MNGENEEYTASGTQETSSGRSGRSGRSRSDRYFSQFHISQFYDAAEDEQYYTDEYINFIRCYDRFVTNSNSMFSRIEEGLRSNISRSMIREYFYYNRYQSLRGEESNNGANHHPHEFIPYDHRDLEPRYREPSAHAHAHTPAYTHAPAPAYTPAHAPAYTPAPAPAHAPAHTPAHAPAYTHTSAPPLVDNRSTRTLSSVLLDFVNRELTRDLPNTNIPRQTHRTPRTPLAFFFDLTADISGNNIMNRIFNQNTSPSVNPNIPTPEQIRLATIDSLYSNIASPINTTCPITREDFTDTSEITQIRNCMHIFNRSNLRSWFRTHPTCPLCRCDIRDYTNVDISQNPTPRNRTDTFLRPDLESLASIMNNNTNINDIYNRIIDNSGNFNNAVIENMNDDEITFSYDLPDVD